MTLYILLYIVAKGSDSSVKNSFYAGSLCKKVNVAWPSVKSMLLMLVGIRIKLELANIEYCFVPS